MMNVAEFSWSWLSQEKETQTCCVSCEHMYISPWCAWNPLGRSPAVSSSTRASASLKKRRLIIPRGVSYYEELPDCPDVVFECAWGGGRHRHRHSVVVHKLKLNVVYRQGLTPTSLRCRSRHLQGWGERISVMRKEIARALHSCTHNSTHLDYSTWAV